MTVPRDVPVPLDTVILTQSEVRRLLSMRSCMDLMDEVLRSLGRGEGMNPLRSGMLLPAGKGILGMMPGVSGSPEALGLKVVTVFPGNHGTEYDSHQGLVVLFDPEYGLPIGIMDASEITAIRTAAVSGVATSLLAREQSTILAIIGSGVQARTHMEAMMLARRFTSVRVYSPTPANREAFARDEASRHGIEVVSHDSVESAVAGADVICTVTSAREPILKGAWIAPGAHINAVGSSVKSTRELNTTAVVMSRLFVDRRESTLNEAGDFLFPKADGMIDDDHILAEIGEVLLGEHPGRQSDNDVTLFKSLGLAVEDLAAAHFVLERARAEGVGVQVPLGGRRHEGG